VRRGILLVSLFSIFSVFAITVSGCAIGLGGGHDEYVHQQTTGKALLDLKAAKDRGAISEEEYQKQKEKIIQAAGR
jgi:uncharacterized membrane protein